MFLTSGLNRVPSPVRGIQCATQAAVDCFAACLRQEMRTRGVDVSVVAAGEFAPGNGWLNETELRDQVRVYLCLCLWLCACVCVFAVVAGALYAPGLGQSVLNGKDEHAACGMRHAVCGM